MCDNVMDTHTYTTHAHVCAHARTHTICKTTNQKTSHYILNSFFIINYLIKITCGSTEAGAVNNIKQNYLSPAMLHVRHQMHELVYITVVQRGITPPGVTVVQEDQTHLEWLHPEEGRERERGDSSCGMVSSIYVYVRECGLQ